MKSYIFYAFFVQATAAVSPFAIFNFLSWVFKLIFLARRLIGPGHHLVVIHLKTFTSESNNFESAAIRYLPKELLTTKITKRHHDLKSVKSNGSAKSKKKHLRQVLMTHYVELIWNTKDFLCFLFREAELSKINLNSPVPIVPSWDVWCLNGYKSTFNKGLSRRGGDVRCRILSAFLWC